jgi:hypothetical protein
MLPLHSPIPALHGVSPKMSYRTFDGYVSPQHDGYIHIIDPVNGLPIYMFDGHNIGFFTNSELVTDASQGVIFIPNSPVIPTALPTGGVVMFIQNGFTYILNANGVVQSAGSTKISRVLTVDANYTAIQLDYQATIMEFTSSTSLGATRNIVVPTNSGYQWTVFNGTTGAQSLQFIGTSGTGITVANGKRAILYADGTNIQRVTPDT